MRIYMKHFACRHGDTNGSNKPINTHHSLAYNQTTTDQSIQVIVSSCLLCLKATSTREQCGVALYNTTGMVTQCKEWVTACTPMHACPATHTYLIHLHFLPTLNKVQFGSSSWFEGGKKKYLCNIWQIEIPFNCAFNFKNWVVLWGFCPHIY